jgi:hypothetical protein
MGEQTGNAMSALPAPVIRHVGDDWRVAGRWPDGRVEDIVTFDSEVEADQWIATEFQAWLDARRKGDSARESSVPHLDA